MKHLVLVVGVYRPHPSPTGKCAKQYISLLKEDYKVDAIYIQSSLKKNYAINIGDETLYGLSNWRLWIEDWFLEKSKKTINKDLNNLYKIGVIAIKAIGHLQSMVFFPNNLRWFYKKAYTTLCKIHKENPIDVVFTVNSPFSAHLAGEALKKKYPNVRWVTYTVDPFYVGFKCGKTVISRKCNKALSNEKCVLSNADANFLSEEVYENSKELYAKFIDKTFPLPYLLPYNDNKGDDRFDSSKINLVYAGRFYKKIRDPEYLLETFLLTKDTNMILHLYTVSDCETVINEYVRKSCGRIIRHEFVDSNEIQQVLCSADVLVNVGNSIPEFKPSKTFEYIATGLPIINFYYNGLKDETLDKYSYALQIDIDMDFHQSAFEIKRFCLDNKGKRMDSSMIDSEYERHSTRNIRNKLMVGME